MRWIKVSSTRKDKKRPKGRFFIRITHHRGTGHMVRRLGVVIPSSIQKLYLTK